MVTGWIAELPVIEMLAFAGKAVERDVLSVVEVIPKTEEQHLVWNTYKKHVQYQWYAHASTLVINIFTSDYKISIVMMFVGFTKIMQCMTDSEF